MARRSKTSTSEDLIGVVALLPWWVGTLLAAIFYFALREVASRYAPSPAVPQTAVDIANIAKTTMIHYGALVGQYVLPFLCLVGAIASVVRRRKRRGLLAAATGAASAQALQDMSWQEFELLIGEAFRARGFTVAETGGPGADGGVDLVLTRGADRHLVQCKHWKAYRVGVSVVRELYGVMVARGATGGHLVTSGRFTSEAVAFASGRGIELLDGSALPAFLALAPRLWRAPTVAEKGGSSLAASPEAQPRTSDVIAGDDLPAALNCPRCGSAMVKRRPRGGAGESFWGCTQFKNGCRGTRPA